MKIQDMLLGINYSMGPAMKSAIRQGIRSPFTPNLYEPEVDPNAFITSSKSKAYGPLDGVKIYHRKAWTSTYILDDFGTDHNILVPMIELESSVDWSSCHTTLERWDVVNRALQVLERSLVYRIEERLFKTLLVAVNAEYSNLPMLTSSLYNLCLEDERLYDILIELGITELYINEGDFHKVFSQIEPTSVGRISISPTEHLESGAAIAINGQTKATDFIMPIPTTHELQLMYDQYLHTEFRDRVRAIARMGILILDGLKVFKIKYDTN